MDANLPVGLKDIQRLAPGKLYEASFVAEGAAAFWLEAENGRKSLVLAARKDDRLLDNFRGKAEPFESEYIIKRCPASHENAAALRRVLSWLAPTNIGLKTSAGFGDRLGIATPGHIRALRSVLEDSPGAEIAPIFAQQSIREMDRTRRSPEDVMTDATWGAFEAGWKSPLGADADHLKTTADVDACVEAGFSFFTIDPGDHVDSGADEAADLEDRLDRLPWDALQSSVDDLRSRYAGKKVELETRELVLDEEAVLRAAVKYGRAVAHVVSMSRHLESKGVHYELEVSVDETQTPTTHAEHVYVASELKRLGVGWISLAPRYVGRFEKGIDYIGGLDVLREDLAGHAEIARSLGPYKLSLHSGSDKFSVYAIAHEVTRGMVHLKTAGTSYLEALRVVSTVEPELFREIASFSFGRYAEDRASYHVSAELSRVPDLGSIEDRDLPRLLDQTDARQAVHVTFGSALDKYRPDILTVLEAHEEAHYETLERHFVRHLAPFARQEE